jgi:hypothetical protein
MRVPSRGGSAAGSRDAAQWPCGERASAASEPEELSRRPRDIDLVSCQPDANHCCARLVLCPAELTNSGSSERDTRGNVMLSLMKLYQERARECALAAEQANKPEDRELLLKWAQEWRAAAREGLTQSTQKK